ncbi:MAG: formate C-acetyltransferase/glycerol dehydratase family glycyl radical enzyme [Clostridiales Family XIII bacterium]|jgi:formate C-acetyltransferase|nr:formate C-acetyltransferase/glycerol dehydratase family glycyl radical enzyme [Clostridiales Family XIII bacterium]
MNYYEYADSMKSKHIFMERPVVRSRRIENLRGRLIDAKAQICSDRAKLLTEAYQNNNSDPVVLKRAKAFAHILDNMKISILDGEIIVGALGTKDRTAPVFPEFGSDWLIEELDGKPMRPEDRPGDRYIIDEEDEKALREINTFWHGNDHESRCLAVLPEETALVREMGVTDSYWLMIGGEGHLVVDIQGVVRKGLKDVIARARARLDEIDSSDPDQESQAPFLRAVIICNEAVIRFAKRYAKIASDLAGVESDRVRKLELEKIADVCNNVPENPARDFHEGVQAMWFINLTLQLENNGHSISTGRFDQTLIDLYENDIRQGTIRYEDALEIVECFFLKVFQLLKVTCWANTKSFAGYQLFQNITVGGQDHNGADSSNELTFLVLNAQAAISLNTPSISLRYHNRIDDRVMYAALDVVRIGGGQPAIYSDEVYIPALMNRGIGWEDAVNYSIVGCVESIVEGKQSTRPNGAGFINLAKIMELALYNGKDPKTGRRLQPGNGDLATFGSYDDLYEAFKIQTRYYFKRQVINDNTIDRMTEEGIADPYVSSLVNDCIARGKTIKQGGAIYDYCGPLYVGAANVGNTLAAVRKVVFDDKKITGAQLLHALETNYGDEATSPTGPEILKLMKDAPKYGNDDEYADSVMVDSFRFMCEETAKYHTTRYGRGPIGGTWQPSTSSVSSNVPMGEFVGATPDGRKAGEALADTSSPMHGTDTKGITASLKSVGKLPTVLVSGGQLLNVKVMPVSLEPGLHSTKLLQVLRTFFSDFKGMHVQLNCVSAETLKAAQHDPGSYKDLMVRVAGYSALFTPLDKALQDDIIERTQHAV